MRSESPTRVVTSAGNERSCVFNGIDGATGRYLQPPLSPRQVAALARSEPRYVLDDRGPTLVTRSSVGRGVVQGIDARDLGQAGWGVIYSPAVDRAVRQALAPLLELRRQQASRLAPGRFQEMDYRPGESKTDFLRRHGVAAGPAVPDRMPYYLLLVGDPEEMPFELQYQLDVQYAVGRLHFETPAEYGRYAHTVVGVESGSVRRPAAAAFFAPRHRDDRPTWLSADQLAAPLAGKLAGGLPGWSVRTAIGDQATKGELAAILEGDDAPALLFTAGHGLCFHAADERQVALQGALLCQDWAGPGQPPEAPDYFAADDVAERARIAGMVAFHFSCFGAGTPRRDGYPEPLHGHREIAPRAFLSQLCQRLLAHPGGGAQAVIGHVDRAWSWSFAGTMGAEPTLRPVFESALDCLVKGYPVGFAMESFNSCYAELASDLDDEIKRSAGADDEHLAELWTSRNDARNYAVIGDPAVRLAVGPVADSLSR